MVAPIQWREEAAAVEKKNSVRHFASANFPFSEWTICTVISLNDIILSCLHNSIENYDLGSMTTTTPTATHSLIAHRSGWISSVFTSAIWFAKSNFIYCIKAQWCGAVPSISVVILEIKREKAYKKVDFLIPYVLQSLPKLCLYMCIDRGAVCPKVTYNLHQLNCTHTCVCVWVQVNAENNAKENEEKKKKKTIWDDVKRSHNCQKYKIKSVFR